MPLLGGLIFLRLGCSLLTLPVFLYSLNPSMKAGKLEPSGFFAEYYVFFFDLNMYLGNNSFPLTLQCS